MRSAGQQDRFQGLWGSLKATLGLLCCPPRSGPPVTRDRVREGGCVHEIRKGENIEATLVSLNVLSRLRSRAKLDYLRAILLWLYRHVYDLMRTRLLSQLLRDSPMLTSRPDDSPRCVILIAPGTRACTFRWCSENLGLSLGLSCFTIEPVGEPIFATASAPLCDERGESHESVLSTLETNPMLAPKIL